MTDTGEIVTVREALNRYVIYRVVLKLDEKKAQYAADQVFEMNFDDATTSMSWLPEENVMETMIKQKMGDCEIETIDEVETKIRKILSLDGIAECFAERYDRSQTFETQNARENLCGACKRDC